MPRNRLCRHADQCSNNDCDRQGRGLKVVNIGGDPHLCPGFESRNMDNYDGGGRERDYFPMNRSSTLPVLVMERP